MNATQAQLIIDAANQGNQGKGNTSLPLITAKGKK